MYVPWALYVVPGRDCDTGLGPAPSGLLITDEAAPPARLWALFSFILANALFFATGRWADE